MITRVPCITICSWDIANVQMRQQEPICICRSICEIHFWMTIEGKPPLWASKRGQRPSPFQTSLSEPTCRALLWYFSACDIFQLWSYISCNNKSKSREAPESCILKQPVYLESISLLITKHHILEMAFVSRALRPDGYHLITDTGSSRKAFILFHAVNIQLARQRKESLQNNLLKYNLWPGLSCRTFWTMHTCTAIS